MFTRVNSRCAHQVRPPPEGWSGARPLENTRRLIVTNRKEKLGSQVASDSSANMASRNRGGGRPATLSVIMCASHADESHRRSQRGPIDGIRVRKCRAHGSERVLARVGARADVQHANATRR